MIEQRYIIEDDSFIVGFNQVGFARTLYSSEIGKDLAAMELVVARPSRQEPHESVRAGLLYFGSERYRQFRFATEPLDIVSVVGSLNYQLTSIATGKQAGERGQTRIEDPSAHLQVLPRSLRASPLTARPA